MQRVLLLTNWNKPQQREDTDDLRRPDFKCYGDNRLQELPERSILVVVALPEHHGADDVRNRHNDVMGDVKVLPAVYCNLNERGFLSVK